MTFLMSPLYDIIMEFQHRLKSVFLLRHGIQGLEGLGWMGRGLVGRLRRRAGRAAGYPRGGSREVRKLK